VTGDPHLTSTAKNIATTYASSDHHVCGRVRTQKRTWLIRLKKFGGCHMRRFCRTADDTRPAAPQSTFNANAARANFAAGWHCAGCVRRLYDWGSLSIWDCL
jgi:hypothetical protein